MKLQRFQLKGFAQHTDLDLHFLDGSPNLIIGPNEAGKSHLMTGLLGTIYGIADPGPYVPWHGEPTMFGHLTFKTGSDIVEIERRFLRDSVDVRVNGEAIYTGRGRVEGRAQEDERYRALLHEWIGFAGPNVFERTVFVGQDLLLDEKLGQFSSQIKRVITGTQEANYDTAIKDLEKELDTLIKQPGKRNNRRKEDLLDRLQDLEQRRAAAAEIQRTVFALIEEERKLQAQLEDAQLTRDRYSTIVEKYGEHQELEKRERDERQRWTDLERQVNELESRQRSRVDLEKQRDELRITGDLTPDQIRKIGWNIEQTEKHIAQIQGWIGQESGTQGRAPSAGASIARATLVVAALAIAALSVVLGILINPVLYAGLLLAVGILVYALVQSTTGARGPDQAPDSPPSDRVSGLEAQLADQKRQLARLRAQEQQLLSETGLPTLDALHARAVEYQRASIALEQTAPVDENELRNLRERLNSAQQDTIIASRGKEELLQQHPEIQSIPVTELENYRRAVDAAKNDQETVSDRLRRIELERRALARGADDAEFLSQEIDELKAEIERVELLADSHELAIATLRESVQEFQENALDPVAGNAARYFTGITDGRYDGVELDRASMTPIVSGNGQREIEFDRLSRGTKDQLYLAIRAALIDALSGERNLPMVLDDPCVHFDDIRLEATADLIAEIARERQILLFTKDENWTRWFEPVLRLHRQDSVIPT